MSNYITKTFQKKLYVDTKSMFYLKNFFTIFETTKIADFQMKRSPNFFFFQKNIDFDKFPNNHQPLLKFLSSDYCATSVASSDDRWTPEKLRKVKFLCNKMDVSVYVWKKNRLYHRPHPPQGVISPTLYIYLIVLLLLEHRT